MKRNARLMILIILALFLMPFVLAYATPLESFAENPIPYWVDNSNGVNLAWNSTAQTVSVNFPSGDYYDFDGSSIADVTTWAPATVSTDGELMSLEFPDTDDWNQAYIDTSVNVTTDYYIEARISCNVTLDNGYIVAYDTDAGVGTALATITVGYLSTLDWYTFRVPITIAGTMESIKFTLADNAHVTFYIDYIHVFPYSNLSLAVPLEPDTTQSIEFMGNFSALNSTVRFQMYDNATPSLFCDVNATQVTFPDSTYAEFTNFARINFTLDEERIIFKIYVFDLNMTLINSYSSYVGPANNDYLFMTDSEFEGSYTLWYLQGDIGYLAEVIDTENIFYLLFLSLEMWGYLGPVMLVIVGYFLADRDTTLGILWFIVECLFVAQYLDLVGATPNYWWHLLIILFGGLVTCIFPAVLKRR